MAMRPRPAEAPQDWVGCYGIGLSQPEGRPETALAKARRSAWLPCTTAKESGDLPFSSPKAKEEKILSTPHLRQRHLRPSGGSTSTGLPEPSCPTSTSSDIPQPQEPTVAQSPGQNKQGQTQSATPTPWSQQEPTQLPGQGQRTQGPALREGFE